MARLGRCFSTALHSIRSSCFVRGVSAFLFAWSFIPIALGSGGASQPVFKVETALVREQRLTRKLRNFGSLESFHAIQVSAKTQGQIVKMLVDEGQFVKEGKLLFELDMRADRIALARAEAELQKAEFELQKMEAGSRPEEIEEARRRLTAAEAVAEVSKDEWERVRELAAQGVLSASELVRARSDFEVSQAQVSQAQARYELIKGGFRQEDILVTEAEVKVRKAQVDDIKRRLEDHSVRAPFAGVIAARYKDMGEWTNSGETVLRLLVLDPMRLRLEMAQEELTHIRAGQTATVSIPGLSGVTLPAEVTAVIPQARVGSRNFPVLLRLRNEDLKLAAGMYAVVELNVDEGQQVLTVPREAVQYRGEQLVVYRLDPLLKNGNSATADPASLNAPSQADAVAAEVKVTITREMETEVVVAPDKSGDLQAGSEVVVLGGSRLTEGSLLQRLQPAAGFSRTE